MLNRRHIRIKVMQSLYASGEVDLKQQEKFLNSSFLRLYDLYLLMVQLHVALREKAISHSALLQKKHLATEQDRNPSKRFIHNGILEFLAKNQPLQEEIRKRKLNNWVTDNEYIDVLFKEMRSSEIYKTYLSSEKQALHNDKEFLATLFKTIIASNEKLFDYIEDQELTWVDDFPVVNTALIKLFRKFSEHANDSFFLPKLFRDEDDRQFGFDLLKRVIAGDTSLSETISSKTKNWDQERITAIDKVLLKMAICELTEFPTIPVKVTMNEYLEIAKEYSTPKSSTFINGILDNLVREYSDNGTLNKSGRGLQ